MNKLTERLFAEGYTKDNHPNYVKWSSGKDFEYTHAYLCKTVWEAPCGLLKNGIHSYEHGSHMGVTYCPENDNPRFGCPYYDEKPCPHRFNTNGLWGWNCAFHQTARLYEYEQSVEKLWDEWDKIKSASWREVTDEYGYCACMKWDRPSRKYIPKYNVATCIHTGRAGCVNEICAITKRPRDLKRVNVFYDILKVRKYKIGLFESVDQTIEKGVKAFESSVARTDAEMWLKLNKAKFEPRLTRDDHRDLFFSEYHGQKGFGNYDWFEFTVTPQNIRVENRESRDLLQDLQDVREGIEVIHASDLQKAAQEAKKDRMSKRQDDKKRKSEKKIISNMLCVVNEGLLPDGEIADPHIKSWALRELEKRGINPMPAQENEQQVLF